MLDVNNLPKGNYVLNLRHNSGLQAIPFVVAKP
jgi:hypothetical protein